MRLPRFPLRWFTITLLVALLLFAYNHLDDVARGVDDEARDALVPSLLLQPIVER